MSEVNRSLQIVIPMCQCGLPMSKLRLSYDSTAFYVQCTKRRTSLGHDSAVIHIELIQQTKVKATNE